MVLEEDTVYASVASATMRCVEVTLTKPLGNWPVYDGATGARPDQIQPGSYGERGWRSRDLACAGERRSLFGGVFRGPTL
jgi:hypothetical protein